MADIQPVNQNDLSDDDILRLTQIKRKEIVDAIAGEKIPDDNNDRKMLLDTLDSMTRQALGNKRIGAAEKMAAADQAAAIAIQQITQKFGSNNPFQSKDGVTYEHQRFSVELESAIQEPETLTGETDVGLSDMTYDEFMRVTDAEEEKSE